MPACSVVAPSITALVSGTFISPAPRPKKDEPGQQGAERRPRAEPGEQH